MTQAPPINDPLFRQVFMTDPSMQNVTRAVVAELFDPDYRRVLHGKRSTRNAGCTGPLCMKALRDWGRERARTKAQMEGRPIQRDMRTQAFLTVEDQLLRLQEAYNDNLLYWGGDELDPVHTALLINHVMSDWKPSTWCDMPRSIRDYANMRGLAGSAYRLAS